MRRPSMSKNIVLCQPFTSQSLFDLHFRRMEMRHEPGKRLASLDKPNKHLTFKLKFSFSNEDGLYYREQRKTQLSRWESFLCEPFLKTEFTFEKILKPLNIDMQIGLGMHHPNQFVYVIHVMVCLLSTLPNQHRRLIQDITEIDVAEKNKSCLI